MSYKTEAGTDTLAVPDNVAAHSSGMDVNCVAWMKWQTTRRSLQPEFSIVQQQNHLLSVPVAHLNDGCLHGRLFLTLEPAGKTRAPLFASTGVLFFQPLAGSFLLL